MLPHLLLDLLRAHQEPKRRPRRCSSGVLRPFRNLLSHQHMETTHKADEVAADPPGSKTPQALGGIQHGPSEVNLSLWPDGAQFVGWTCPTAQIAQPDALGLLRDRPPGRETSVRSLAAHFTSLREGCCE